MNILLDFIPLQYAGGIGGAASFTKRVIDEVVARNTDNSLFALYDSRLGIGRQYDYRKLAMANNIYILDIAENTISRLIRRFNIDVLFVAIGQFYANYDLTGIKCKVVMFIHDIFDIQRNDNHIDLITYHNHITGKWRQTKKLINIFTGRWRRRTLKCYNNILPLYTSPNTQAFTVSYYTKEALHYYFPQISKEIRVCYPPIKNTIVSTSIENCVLREIIETKSRYLLFLAANREYKNAELLLKVFPRIAESYPGLKLITLKSGKSINDNHIDIDYLSDSDLSHAYQNATALVFPSFFEGFGYPPVEAMKYGTPTIASNVTSIPEVMGNACEYFSPFYASDLYRAVKQVIDNPDNYQDRMSTRLKHIEEKQKKDIDFLIKEILNT